MKSRLINGKTRRFLPLSAIAAASLILVLALSMTSASAQSDGAAENVPDLSGYWMRPEGGNGRMFYPLEDGSQGPLVNTDTTGEFTIGDHTNPILQPRAAAAVEAHGDEGRAGNVIYPAWSLCWPPAVPLILNMAEPVQFLQEADRVTILYQRGMQFRQIYLNEAHPEDIAPSWNGHSVGHYENGDTLVVDTVAQDTRSLTDRFGTPKSEALRVVERYTISPDRRNLNVVFDVEDLVMFTAPWSARTGYVRPSARPGYEPGGFNRDDEAIQEGICAENNRDAVGGLFPIPMDEGPPDF